MLERYLSWSNSLDLHWSLLIGIMLLTALIGGTLIRLLRLPSIVGTLIFGVLLGPSLLNLVPMSSFKSFSFITDLALAMVALNLGLEFSLATIRRLGSGIIVLIICESFFTFALIGAAVFLFSGNLILALIAGAVGAASAPTGPVAVVQENRARGPLTSSIFAVVGFDDAVGILIFSFAHAVARHLLILETPGFSDTISGLGMLIEPLKEIGLSAVFGLLAGLVFCLLARGKRDINNLFLWLIATMFLLQGLSHIFEFSTILANMMLGALVVNFTESINSHKITERLGLFMPLIFTLFFVFTGVQLDISLLPSIGLLGLVFLFSRGGGKFLGCLIGAGLGRLESVIRKRLWMGLLSQIGVGTGLVLIIIDDFGAISEAGRQMGLSLLAVVTATSLVFELVGPWLTTYALRRSGEIPTEISE